MAFKSSKNMTATWNGTAIPEVTDFKGTKDSGTQKHSSSSTAGKYRRNSGATDHMGTLDVMSDSVPFVDGETGTLIVTSDGTVELFNDLVYIEKIDHNVPVDGGGNVLTQVSWGRTVA